ncbi:hypothetical protein QJQ45_026653, partial [Haematococcus lacustris]
RVFSPFCALSEDWLRNNEMRSLHLKPAAPCTCRTHQQLVRQPAAIRTERALFLVRGNRSCRPELSILSLSAVGPSDATPAPLSPASPSQPAIHPPGPPPPALVTPASPTPTSTPDTLSAVPTQAILTAAAATGAAAGAAAGAVTGAAAATATDASHPAPAPTPAHLPATHTTSQHTQTDPSAATAAAPQPSSSSAAAGDPLQPLAHAAAQAALVASGAVALVAQDVSAAAHELLEPDLGPEEQRHNIREVGLARGVSLTCTTTIVTVTSIAFTTTPITTTAIDTNTTVTASVFTTISNTTTDTRTTITTSVVYHHHLQPHPYLALPPPCWVQALREPYRQVLYFLGWGVLCMAGLWSWASGEQPAVPCMLAGSPLRKSHPYTFTITFPCAEGLQRGVPLRLKGVTVGSVDSVSVDLHQLVALVLGLACRSARRCRSTWATPLSPVVLAHALTSTRQASLKGGRPPSAPICMMNPEAFIDISTARLKHAPPDQPTQLGGRFAAAIFPDHHTHLTSPDARAPAQPSPSDLAHVPSTTAASASEGSCAASTADGRGRGRGRSSRPGARRQARAEDEEEREGSLTLEQLHACALPADVDNCRAQGLLVCAGDVVEGHVGASMDELTRGMVMGNRGVGKIQDRFGYYTGVAT